MELNVEQENLAEVLQSVRELLRDNILPRLTDLEEQVRLLRKVTWPVCQGIREKTQLDDIQSKKDFLRDLDLDEILLLLRLKSKGLLFEECHKLGVPYSSNRKGEHDTPTQGTP
jgi:hypothetical protein